MATSAWTPSAGWDNPKTTTNFTSMPAGPLTQKSAPWQRKSLTASKARDCPYYQKTLPDRGVHPLNFIIETVLILLGLLAALSMFLSGLLVVNVISALIAQQEKQIGIMKAIGARSWQIIGLYFGMVLALGLVACLLAIPFSKMGANALAQLRGGTDQLRPAQSGVHASALLTQFGVGLIVPLHRRRTIHFQRHKDLAGARPQRVWHQSGMARRGLHGCDPQPLPEIYP